MYNLQFMSAQVIGHAITQRVADCALGEGLCCSKMLQRTPSDAALLMMLSSGSWKWSGE